MFEFLTASIAYCSIKIAHIGYSLWTGISSNCWDSVTELLILAINPPPASELRNTGAVVDTLGVYRLSVRLAETTEARRPSGRLGLLFASTGRDYAINVRYDRKYD